MGRSSQLTKIACVVSGKRWMCASHNGGNYFECVCVVVLICYFVLGVEWCICEYNSVLITWIILEKEECCSGKLFDLGNRVECLKLIE